MYSDTILNNADLTSFCKKIALDFGFTVCGFSVISDMAESLSLMYDGYRSHNTYELDNYVEYIIDIMNKTQLQCNKYKTYLQNFFMVKEIYKVHHNVIIRDNNYNCGFVWLNVIHGSISINIFFNDSNSSLNTSFTNIDKITHTRISNLSNEELIEMYMFDGTRSYKQNNLYKTNLDYFDKKLTFKNNLDYAFCKRYLNIQHFIQMYFEYTIFQKNKLYINGLEPIQFMNAFCIPITEHEYVENITEYTGLIHDISSIISDYVGGNSSEIDYRFITNVERYSKTCSNECLHSDVVLRYSCCEQLQCFRHAFNHFTKNNFVNYRNIHHVTDCTHTVLYFTNYNDD
jgi:hypothetical protein